MHFGGKKSSLFFALLGENSQVDPTTECEHTHAQGPMKTPNTHTHR